MVLQNRKQYSSKEKSEGEGLASARGDTGADRASGELGVAVGSRGERAAGGLVGSTAKVVVAGDSESTVSRVQRLLGTCN